MLITTYWASTQPTPSLCALEPAVVMAAVIRLHQSVSVIRVGEEHLVQPLCVPRLALCMANVTR